jgi:hypothetical protein
VIVHAVDVEHVGQTLGLAHGRRGAAIEARARATRGRFKRSTYAVLERSEASERSTDCSYFHVSPSSCRAVVCVMRSRA